MGLERVGDGRVGQVVAVVVGIGDDNHNNNDNILWFYFILLSILFNIDFLCP